METKPRVYKVQPIMLVTCIGHIQYIHASAVGFFYNTYLLGLWKRRYDSS